MTARLHGAIIWAPMLEKDNRAAARLRESIFSDIRLVQCWDPERIVGRSLARTLALKAAIAWDVYLLYPPGTVLEGELPPAPAYWMHQLNEEPTLLLDPSRLRKAVHSLLERNLPQ